MKCDLCNEKEATVHLTEIINGEIQKLHICEECAKKKGKEMQAHFGLSDLLSSLMDFEPSIPQSAAQKKTAVKCPVCGMTYYDFQKTGRLGCGRCYKTFEKELGALLRKIHGSERHIGKMPLGGKETLEDQQEIMKMKKELEDLAAKEEFEKAAVLRDKIKELENRKKNES
jgi:protein arginine kinase activator